MDKNPEGFAGSATTLERLSANSIARNGSNISGIKESGYWFGKYL
jgi:hypothetical protein